jgi:hypothetical protein
MCVCPTPAHCHRWTLAEAALARLPGLNVQHIMKKGKPIRQGPQLVSPLPPAEQLDLLPVP